MTIWHSWRAAGFNRLGISAKQFAALRQGEQSLASFGAYRVYRALIMPGMEAESVRMARATSGVLESLGIQPILGRSFRREDELPGSSPVVLLSHAPA